MNNQNKTLYELFLISPELALNKKFEIAKTEYMADRIFVYRYFTNPLDGVGYGSYNYVDREELSRRPYTVKFIDDKIAIHFHSPPIGYKFPK